MRADIVAGATFPDYELPDHTDVKRKLSFLQGPDPMILTLNRGFFCPKDRLQLHRLAEFSAECVVGYTRIVTITTDTLVHLNELRQGVGADWTFLHDEERTIQRELEIEEYTDPENDPMIPYTFVLKPELVIHRIYNGYWYWGRPSTAELHGDLREVTREIRPDWKIDTRRMRKRWEADEREAFFPYGRDMQEVMARMSNVVDRFGE